MFIAKQNTWFDVGTEAELLCGPYEAYDDCQMTKRNDWGLFRGIKDGHLDEEECTLDEFEVI